MRLTLRKLAYSDLKVKYRNTFLGPIWMVISLAMGSLGLGFLWSELWNLPKNEVIPSITVGFLTWMFLSGVILESTECYLRQQEIVKNLVLPLMFVPCYVFLKHLISFAHSFLIIIPLLIVYPPSKPLSVLLIIPGLIISSLTIFFVSVLVAIVSLRFRDISPLITTIMPMLFFFSPVLFRVNQLENLKIILFLNPFTYLITLIKDPLLGNNPSVTIWAGATFICLLSLLSLLLLLKFKRKNIIFWI